MTTNQVGRRLVLRDVILAATRSLSYVEGKWPSKMSRFRSPRADALPLHIGPL